MGVLYGSASAVYRGHPVWAPSTALGLNYLFVSYAVFFSERVACDVSGCSSSWGTFLAGGAATGACIKMAQGGLKMAPQGAAVFGALGVGMFFGLEGWERLKDHWRQERIQELAGTKKPYTIWDTFRSPSAGKKPEQVVPKGRDGTQRERKPPRQQQQ
ncbi:hypothetical protein JKP88DRAFT_232436 [Tribonema minus]|uniref:Uncharacterized protein n=1 Tax=Tribonema minus TaxID=303371 RepID=A0A836CM11_9STRA|nr:hypothetical protein JKP88DRAFT_232436 [Tribonema minus]